MDNDGDGQITSDMENKEKTIDKIPFRDASPDYSQESARATSATLTLKRPKAATRVPRKLLKLRL